jgi:toxin ParE1/3/4
VKRVNIHRQAEAELDAAIAHYEGEQKGVGAEFLAEVHRTKKLIEQFPQLGTPYLDTEFRTRKVKRFPYILVYCELADSIWLMAVAHGKKRPGYWLGRAP